MSQQINLADPRLLPRGVAFSSRQALAGVLAVVALGGLGSLALNGSAASTRAETQRLQQRLAALPASAPTASDGNALLAEITQLRRLDADQQRVRSALASGAAGGREGPAEYFTALARQAHGSVWITAFAVADDGQAIELEGRMTEADALTDYLRRLNAEARFRGRPFAQFSLKAMDGERALPYAEFALRSAAAAKAP